MTARDWETEICVKEDRHQKNAGCCPPSPSRSEVSVRKEQVEEAQPKRERERRRREIYFLPPSSFSADNRDYPSNPPKKGRKRKDAFGVE